MKKVLVFLFLVVSLFSYADPDEIVLNPSGSGDVTLAGGFEVELGARFTVQRTSYK
jgi:hypothetical protein